MINDEDRINSLSKQQRAAFDMVIAGKNIYIGGIAGSGKSYLIDTIKYYIAQYNKEIDNGENIIPGRKQNIVIVGTTGVSAINVNGKTLHSWASIGICKDYADICYTYLNNKRMKTQNEARKETFRSTDILIIDEVSMLTSALLDALNTLAKRMRGSFAPMGGIQTILVGDFCQLPPVVNYEERVNGVPYCFLSSSWGEIVDEHVFLTDNFRQSGDEEYYKILLSVRNGTIPKEYYKKIIERIKPPPITGDIHPTILYSRNINVDSINHRELNKLITDDNPLYRSEIFVTASLERIDNKDKSEKLKHFALSTIAARAMILSVQNLENLKDELVKTKQLYKQEADGEFAVGAQVMCTINMHELNLVNGSRGVVTDILKPEKCLGRIVPVVQFQNGLKLPMPVSTKPCSISAKYIGGNGYKKVQATIAYFPLRLAWALTIHKSQGLTLDMVQTSLGKNDIFDYGMGYVAMSRVKNLNSLYLDDFDRSSIYTDPEVISFYDLVIKQN